MLFSIDIDEVFDANLTILANSDGITKAEVIVKAVATYMFLKKETAGEDKLAIINEQGKAIKTIELP